MSEESATQEQSSFSATYADAVRLRLQKAQRLDWAALIADLKAEPDPPPATRSTRRAAEAAEVWDAPTLTRAAILSQAGSTRAASSTLVDQPPVDPSPAVVAQMEAQFRTEPLSPDELERRQATLKSIGACGKRHVKPTSPRKAASKADQLRAAAGPGPSGMRNGIIQLISRVRGGPETLARWCDVWAFNRIHPSLADLWTPCILRPFWKPAPHKEEVRPVTCAESLLKFAVGCTVELQAAATAKALGSRQFGAGEAAGAAAQIAEVRASARAFPHKALAQLDIKNAFGSVDRSDALDVTRHAVPGLAPLLAAQWGDRPQRLWAEREPGVWVAIVIWGGLLQGGQDGQPVFCLVIAAVVAKMENSLPREIFITVALFIFVDDVTIQAETSTLLAVVGSFAEACAGFHLAFERSKSKCHVPAWADRPPPREARTAISAHIPISDCGLELLGCACQGLFAAPLYPAEGEAIGPTAARANRAVRLASAAAAMARAALPCGGKQAAWHIIQRNVAHSMDYDARICSVGSLAPLALRVDTAVEQAVGAIVAVEPEGWPDGFREQLRLPVDLGGFQVQSVRDLLAPARIAEFLEGGPRLRRALANRLPEGTPTADVDETPAAREAQAELAAQGLHIGRCGEPADAECRDALVPEAPARHLLSAWLRARARLRHRTLLQRLPTRGQLRLRSAGGPNAGQCLLASPTRPVLSFSDVDWAEGLRWRGGFPQQTRGTRCQNIRTGPGENKGEPCNAVLDDDGDHAATCPCGPCVVARHGAVVIELGSLCKAAGAVCRCEVPVAQLEDAAGGQAVLDLVTWGAAMPDAVIDVTVRHPGAARYAEEAATTAGACAAKAEEDKANDYPARGGVAVLAFAAETWGRLGLQAEQFLRTAGAEAAARAVDRGHPAPRLRRWRAAIDAAIMKGVVRGLRHAREGPGGVELRRAETPWPRRGAWGKRAERSQ